MAFFFMSMSMSTITTSRWMDIIERGELGERTARINRGGGEWEDPGGGIHIPCMDGS